MKTILAVANETIGGKQIIELITEKAGDGKARLVICVPRTQPNHGNVIYDDAVYDAARVRVDLARTFLRTVGIEAIGEVGDPDPYSATMDAVAEYHPDEIIISTKPATSSGWLKRDLIERIQDASGLPVQHIVTDVDTEGIGFGVTLVVANRTAAADELLTELKKKAGSERHVFVVVVPQEGGEGTAARRARARLVQLVDRLRAADLLAAGMIADPDPYTATMNAMQFFHVEDIVISTLPATRSGWLRADLIQRVTNATGKPVTHIEATPAGSPAAA
ncbi:hypothetical protein DSM112329_03457 [Paraconexibacter sp. AEG42_29]|uniref:Universal stress protein n=1 Tax=Paraconexibacter sp. AEG42_29 TaxID=2997339 RepID=A0AAU7AY51_9ACTN